MHEIYDFLYKGGPVMIPIMLLSVVALAIFLERMWFLQMSLVAPEGFAEKIQHLLSTGKKQEAVVLCQTNSTPLAKILLVIIGNENVSGEETLKLAEEVGKREASKISRYIEALGTISTVEPLLGLLGTVTGLIKAFQRVVYYAGEGAVDPAKLASGIWEALITTAAGLIIAIPCYLGYKYLVARADSLISRIEEASNSIYYYLKFHSDKINPKEDNHSLQQGGTSA